MFSIYFPYIIFLILFKMSQIRYTGLLLLVLLGFMLIGSIKAQLTVPIQHNSALKEDQQKIKHDHNCSYYTYHNSRNHQKPKARHDLHLTATTGTKFPIISMGYFFTLPLTIGGINYQLNVDTGSSDIFIKAQGCKGAPTVKYSCPSCPYNNQPFMLSYIDGVVQTYEKHLNVTLGTHSYKEHILIALSVPHNFYRPQGVIGLSYPALSISPYPNFIQTLINNGIVSHYSFGLSLNFQSNTSSFINFGKPDTSLYTGILNKFKLQGQYSYKIFLDSLQIGNNGPDLAIYLGILDSGNTCITMPAAFAPIVITEFNSNNGINVCAFDLQPYAPSFKLLRCKVKNFTILPVINIYINHIQFSIDYNSYFQRCVFNAGYYLCDTYIETVNFGSALFIGDGFFNRYYTFFDLTNGEVGIAKNNNNLKVSNTFKPYSTLSTSDIRFFNTL